ncbi:hypothetical protein BDZ91DRAFT_732510 [Kalaharituber pfeilii]|nr:hypothetical protein BDZ91DRAFT_732510 [Kalaharituber pfeilii]
MELPKPPQKGHSRAPSSETSRKVVTSPRRRTLGRWTWASETPSTPLGSLAIQSPLDPAAPTASTSSSHPLQTPTTPSTTTTTSRLAPPTSPRPSSRAGTPSTSTLYTEPRIPLPLREFPQLIQPHIFHPLPNHDLPLPSSRQSTGAGLAFPSTPTPLTPRPQPTPDTPLPELLAGGYFRAAAITAANTLGTLSAGNYPEIFRLWYIRLACLCIIGATTVACQEVKTLEDLNAPSYWQEIPPRSPPGPGQAPARPQRRHLVPWELRLLAIRLQALSFNDWRRALVFYYDLAREARIEAVKAAENGAAVQLWKNRLADLSIRVASALIEMGDLAAAARHLESLRPGDTNSEEDIKIRFMLCLLYIKIGNFKAAQEALPPPPLANNTEEAEEDAEELTTDPLSAPHPPTQPYTDALISALLHITTSSFPLATTAFSALSSLPPSSPSYTTCKSHNPMARLNTAVSLVYTGRLSEARDIMEDLVEEGNAFWALTFNLATVYELCSDGERTREMKRELAERVVMRGARVEVGNAWVKL